MEWEQKLFKLKKKNKYQKLHEILRPSIKYIIFSNHIMYYYHGFFPYSIGQLLNTYFKIQMKIWAYVN